MSTQLENVQRLSAAVHTTLSIHRVLRDVRDERVRQIAKWGLPEKDHADGTGPMLDILEDCGVMPGEGNSAAMEDCQDRTDALAKVPGRLTWAHILTEEWAEAMAAEDPAHLRAELVQVAAVAVKWIEALDRRADR